MANKTIQLLRNKDLYESREAALTGLKAKLGASGKGAIADGQPILARYTGGDNKEHTLLGIKSATGYEIFDNEGTSADIQAAIAALDAEVTSTDGKNVNVTVTEVDGKITGVSVADNSINATDLSDAIEALDVTDTALANQFVTSVSETDGKISVQRAQPAAAGVTVADEDGYFTATNVEGALAELAAKAASISVGSTDKTVNVTTTASGTNLAVNIDSTTIIKNTDGVLSTNLEVAKLTADEVTKLSDANNVKEAYKLIYKTDAGRTAIGDVVKIYKDSSLHSVYLGHVDDHVTSPTDPTVVHGTGDAALCFIHQKADGTYELVAVNVESFLEESEFKNGLQVVNHEVSVKVDSESESFLSVSSDGVKVSGVSAAITKAIDALDVTTDAAVAGQYVAAIEETNGLVAVKTRANVSDAVLNGYAKGTKPASTAIVATDDVKGAIAKLEHQIDDAKAAATTKVKKDTQASHLTLQSATAADGSVTYTIGESDIASKTDLDAEITARKAVDGQSGQTYAANTKANYIAQAGSLNDADVKLDAALKTADDAMLTRVAAGNGISVADKANKSQTITAVAVTGDPIIEVTAKGIGTKEDAVWECGTY